MDQGWDLAWGAERLLGEWSFEREISGPASSGGTMTGLARFEPTGAGQSLYSESGDLRLPDGSTLHGEQRYVYRWIEGGFEIYFHGTEELFERVSLVAGEGDWKSEAQHLCRADHYESQYWFRGDGTFEIRHKVFGPKKDFTITTQYRKKI